MAGRSTSKKRKRERQGEESERGNRLVAGFTERSPIESLRKEGRRSYELGRICPLFKEKREKSSNERKKKISLAHKTKGEPC